MSIALEEKRTVYHSDQWRKALCEMYGYAPVLELVERGGATVALASMVRSGLFAKNALRALPASMYGHLIAESEADEQELIAALCHGAMQSGMSMRLKSLHATQRLLSLRGLQIDARVPIGTADECWAALCSSAKRNVRRSRKEGVHMSIGSVADLPEFMRLLATTRRRLGLPVPHRRWFRHLLGTGLARLIVGRSNGTAQAAVLFLSDSNNLHYAVPAYADESNRTRALDGCIWELIKIAAAEEKSWLCMGGSASGNDGLRRYKRKWGAEERNVYELSLPCGKMPTKEPTSGSRMLRRLPTPALELLGHAYLRYLS